MGRCTKRCDVPWSRPEQDQVLVPALYRAGWAEHDLLAGWSTLQPDMAGEGLVVPDERSTCEYIKGDGNRCRAKARPGRTLCFSHCPLLKGRRDAARRAGGIASAKRAVVLPANTPDLPLANMADLVGLLATSINQVRRGELDPKIGNAIAYMSSVFIRALENGDLERRMSALEARSAEQNKTPIGNGVAPWAQRPESPVPPPSAGRPEAGIEPGGISPPLFST
jgi:hypothetical protein